jgi:hypothetical protein
VLRAARSEPQVSASGNAPLRWPTPIAAVSLELVFAKVCFAWPPTLSRPRSTVSNQSGAEVGLMGRTSFPVGLSRQLSRPIAAMLAQQSDPRLSQPERLAVADEADARDLACYSGLTT